MRKGFRSRSVVSHISRKTSEMWGTQDLFLIRDRNIRRCHSVEQFRRSYLLPKWIAIALVGLVAATGCSHSTPTPAAQAQSGAADALRKLADEYFDQVYFHYAPSTATSDGFHQYDAQLEDFSRGAVDRETGDLQRFEGKFAAIPTDQLDLTSQGDLELLLANIHGRLLRLNTIRLWEKDPDQYSSGISNSAFVLMERNFASPDDRLRSLVAREKLMPAALDEARQNLKNPPQIYTEIALEQLPDIISFFQKDVPTAFKQAQNEQLKERIFTIEQRRDRGSQELPGLAQERRPSALSWRFPVWRGDLFKAAAIRRNGGHTVTQAVANWICGPAPKPGGLQAHRRGS